MILCENMADSLGMNIPCSLCFIFGDYTLRVLNHFEAKFFRRSSRADCSKEAEENNSAVVTISECADEIYFVLAWSLQTNLIWPVVVFFR